MSQTHWLRLGIDASKASSGGKVFTSATSMVAHGARKAVSALNPFHMSLVKVGGYLSAGALIYGINKTVKEFATFEKQVASVSTMLDTQTMRYLPAYSTALRSMSKEFGEGTETLSKGLYDILSASVDAGKALEVLEVSAKAAKAGMTTTGIAVDAITTVMNAYGMSADKATMISDIMFATVKRGKTTFAELAPNIGKVASIAATAGLSFEEFAAAIATMTRAGVRTEIAITALKSIMTTFLDPQEDAIKLAKQYGFELSAATLKTEGLTGVLQKLKGMEEEHLTVLMPNVRGMTGFAAQLQNVEGNVYDLNFMMNSSGRTLEAYNKMVSISDHSFEKLKQTIRDTKIIIGNAFAPEWVKSAEEINHVLDKNQDKISYWAKVTSAEVGRVKDYMFAFATYLKNDWPEAADAGIDLFLAALTSGGKAAIDIAVRTGRGIWKGVKEGIIDGHTREIYDEAEKRYHDIYAQAPKKKPFYTVTSTGTDTLGSYRRKYVGEETQAEMDALADQVARERISESAFKGMDSSLRAYVDEFNRKKEQILNEASKTQDGKSFTEAILLADDKASRAKAMAEVEMINKQNIEKLKSIADKAKQLWQYIKSPWTNPESNLAGKTASGLDQIEEVYKRKIRMPQIQQYFDDMDFEISLLGKTNEQREKSIELRNFEMAAMEAYRGNQERVNDELQLFSERLDDLMEARKLQELADGIGDSFGRAFEDMVTGARSAADAIRALAQDVTRLVMRQTITQPLADMISGGFTSIFSGGLAGNQALIKQAGGLGSVANSLSSGWMQNALGNAFMNGRPIAFANGGVVNRPTLFPMRNGTGLMGEAGPEAIMPLKRGNDGKLGVSAQSQPINVTVVNRIGPETVTDSLNTKAGERVILNIIKKNRGSIGGMLG